ncbi:MULTISPECIES: methyltransferase [Streptomyces]|nr:MULTISPECIES: methyltransferase [Streptomyces]AZK97384.1 SAM-dependent methyltransferase [Streptomyces tsukubensis]EIF93531.1 o-demethylpuromycin-o-methyltransferase [Streptomyces tsukubensis NRRL18488]
MTAETAAAPFDADPDGMRSAALLIDLAESYLFPAALRAAAAIGAADHLADGPRDVAALARATHVDAGSLYRVLRLLATRGLFDEVEHGTFRLTVAGDALRSDAPASVRAAILMITGPEMWLPAGELTRCVTEGGSVFESVFGKPFFEHFAQNPETTALFDDGMAEISRAEDGPSVAVCSFAPGSTVVDVGGGQGGLLREVLTAHPNVRGVLFDRPHVLPGHRLDVPATSGRWELAAGDFFESVPPGAETYVLKRILHDWEDEQCVTILRNCREAMAPGGRVLVVDSVLPTGNTPHQGKGLDLMMMASLVGQERTEAEFEELFRAAGLHLTRVILTETVPSVVEGVAAGD